MTSHEGSEFAIAHAEPLTLREAEVLLWTAEGKTAWETGRILGMTEGTARVHMTHVLGKLNAANKPHAVARGFAAGIIGRKLMLLLLIAAGAFVHPDQSQARAPRRPRETRETRETRGSSRGESLTRANRRL